MFGIWRVGNSAIDGEISWQKEHSLSSRSIESKFPVKIMDLTVGSGTQS